MNSTEKKRVKRIVLQRVIEVALIGNIDRARTQEAEHCQINPSCLLSYLGIKGYANIASGTTAAVKKNITAGLAYWDIFKNYHANKQEPVAYYIGKNINLLKFITPSSQTNINPGMSVPITNGVQASISFNGKNFEYKNIVVTLNSNGNKIKKSIDEIDMKKLHNISHDRIFRQLFHCLA